MQETFKNTLQDCNINFLLGSGMSRPFLATLSNIETLLTELDASAAPPDVKAVVRASIYRKYFVSVICDNTKILSKDATCIATLDAYVAFLRILNAILLKRKGTILSKETNLFTTNIDIFLERALEDLGVEFNDGFNGRFAPTFSISNYKKTRAIKSLHYDNVAELPVFNLVKLHGSLTWTRNASHIGLSYDLKHIGEVAGSAIPDAHCVAVLENSDLQTLIAAAAGKLQTAEMMAFMAAYEKLLVMVNPTKDKFRDTLINQTYYDLLRLFANELEKENTVLFVMGFSFADEHIREIVLRAANSNPTLMINVFAHSTAAGTEILGRFPTAEVRNNNVKVIVPTQSVLEGLAPDDDFKYDLTTITSRVFTNILTSITGESGK